MSRRIFHLPIMLLFILATFVVTHTGCRAVTNTETTLRILMRPYLAAENPKLPSFDDPIFRLKTRMTGILNPHQFADEIGFWIFTTKPHRPGRIPVLFVHGHLGGPQAFEPMAESLDPSRFEAWFAYYPAGLDINETADMFRQALSRRAIRYNADVIVIVAMSMGGLVTRQALKPAGDGVTLPRIPLFIGIANPWGGSIKTGTGANLAVAARPEKKISYGAESWKQFEAGAPFLAQLFDRPLPEETAFHMIYGVGGDDDVLPGRDDGSLSEESLARPEAVSEAASVTVVADGLHESITIHPETIARVDALLDTLVPPTDPKTVNTVWRGAAFDDPPPRRTAFQTGAGTGCGRPDAR